MASIEVDGTVKERWPSGDGNELPDAGLFTGIALKYLYKLRYELIANKFRVEYFRDMWCNTEIHENIVSRIFGAIR